MHLGWKQFTVDSRNILEWTVNVSAQNGSSFKDINDIYFYSLDGSQEFSSVDK